VEPIEDNKEDLLMVIMTLTIFWGLFVGIMVFIAPYLKSMANKKMLGFVPLMTMRNSCTPSPLRYALTKKLVGSKLLCSYSLTSKVIQGK